MLEAATIAAYVCALLAICAALAIWVRSTPFRVLQTAKDAQECAAKAEAAATRATEDAAGLRVAWQVHQQEIEKYLDSIDSRARRLSATESQRRKREEPQDGPAEDDPEALMAALRLQQGI